MAFNKKPLALACHLCGSEFGTTSIAIHIPTCEKKWLAAQEILPPHLVRRRAPRPPECPIPDSKHTFGIEQYNEEAYSIYNQESRASCPSCQRQFNPEALMTHMKSCSANTSSPKSSSSSRTKTPTSNRKSLDPSSLRNSLTKTPSTSSPSSKGSPTPKDPTSVTCHVCGRPFGTRSIASHIPKCKENYAQIQSKLPSKSMRKNPPSDPTIPLPTDTKSSDFDLQLQAYNDEAYSIYEQQARNQCNYCKKKFDAEKIEQHVNVCVKKPKESSSEGSGMVPKLGEKPATLFCYLCGREFGLQSLDIHIPQCIKKREAVQEQLPKELRCKAPKGPTIPYPTDKGSETFKEDLEAFNQQAYRIYEDSSRLQCKGCGRRFNAEALLVHLKSCAPAQEKMAQSAPSGPASRPRMLICSICGREFGSKSLPIHQKQCLLKHGMSEDDLPKMQQQMPINAGKMSAEELDKFNEKAFSNFTENTLVPCENCGRRFLPDRLPVHQRSCKPGSGSKPINKPSLDRPGSRSSLGSSLPSMKSDTDAEPQDFSKSADLSGDDRVPCSKCGRKFAPDRVGVHENTCKAVAPVAKKPSSSSVTKLPEVSPTSSKRVFKVPSSDD